MKLSGFNRETSTPFTFSVPYHGITVGGEYYGKLDSTNTEILFVNDFGQVRGIAPSDKIIPLAAPEEALEEVPEEPKVKAKVPKLPKILIIGTGRHGKDTVAEILRDYLGFTFDSSSHAAYEIFIYDLFKDRYGYSDLEEAYEDRHAHREELFKLIQEYNTPDKAKLAKEILSSTGMYVGMRCEVELQTCIAEGVFDLIIWVDAKERVDFQESSDSITVHSGLADVVIENNGSLDELKRQVIRLGRLIRNGA